MLKLQRYDSTFLRKFHSMSRYLQWNEDDVMYHLCGFTDATTSDVIKLLQTRFSTKLQAERFKMELFA